MAGDPVAIPRPGSNYYPVLSLSGRYMAYTSDRLGDFEVYVRPFSGGRGEWKVSVNGGGHALWNGQGDELFYVAPDSNAMMVVKVDTQSDRFGQGSPLRLFSLDQAEPVSAAGSARRFYDVTADGQRFVMIQRNRPTILSSMTIVQNWYAEFKDRE